MMAPTAAHDLVDAARMEQLAIQRMRSAVIAKIEPEHVEARSVAAIAPTRQHVARCGAAFPAVQQDREPAAAPGEAL